jgi:small subunit ribosomal protein S1
VKITTLQEQMTDNSVEASSASNVVELPDNIKPEDFPALLEKTLVSFNNGDVIEGTVVKVDRNEVMVDVGYKSEGIIPSRELSVRKGVNPKDLIKQGEKIKALVLEKEDDEGRLILSIKRAVYEKAWVDIQGIADSKKSIKGTVIESVKGGLIVDIGVRGFLPASLIDVRRVKELSAYVGEEIEAKILELDRQKNNIVLSRKAHLEEELSEERQGFLDDLQIGDVKDGKISSIVSFGLGRKITSLTLMTIMVAGGLTIAFPGVMPEAMAANANLFVSAENSQFNNRISAQIKRPGAIPMRGSGP